jgi:hypothetical protein
VFENEANATDEYQDKSLIFFTEIELIKIIV